jgi:hypothetical protein
MFYLQNIAITVNISWHQINYAKTKSRECMQAQPKYS